MARTVRDELIRVMMHSFAIHPEIRKDERATEFNAKPLIDDLMVFVEERVNEAYERAAELAASGGSGHVFQPRSPEEIATAIRALKKEDDATEIEAPNGGRTEEEGGGSITTADNH